MKYIMIDSVFIFVCCQSPNSSEKDKQEIEAVRRQHAEAAMKGDADAYINFLTDDATYLIPNETELEETENIKNYLKKAMETASFKIIQHPAREIEILGTTAYVQYRVSIEGTLKADGSSFNIERKYLDIWKKVNGAWKVHRYMWNDLPSE